VAYKQVGDPCTVGWGECALTTYCSPAGRCTDVGATVGEACSYVNGENIPCAAGDYCSFHVGGAPPSCAAHVQPGQPCTGDPFQCTGNGAYCDTGSMTCKTCPL
jgi:hypothetical protein